MYPIRVKLTRYAPRMLDKHDNLPYSFKWIYDAVCDYCRPGLAAGRADDTDDISVEYDQVKQAKYEIKVEIYHE